MPTDFFERCDAIEECYEFLLAYAGQGLPSDEGSQVGSQVREFLQRAATALTGLAESCARAVAEEGLEPGEAYRAFGAVLQRDAQDALAAIQIVLAQPAISSQLIDNLNASMHLRALLTDLFLIGEILRSRSHTEVTSGTD
jgi:heme oxygenase